MPVTFPHAAFAALVLLTVLLQPAYSRLVIVEAGPFKTVSKPEIELTPGKVLQFCPKSYSSKGFSIDCRAPGLQGPVAFYVNGHPVRVENFPPFTIAGDYANFRYPFTAYKLPEVLTVMCKAKGISTQTAVVRIKCPTPSKEAEYKLKPTQMPASTSVQPVRTDGCVVIDAGNNLGPLPKGWTKEKEGGITYLKGDSRHGVEKPGTASLTYTFMVSRKSKYAVTLDMTTRHPVDYNDVFLKFMYGGGFELRKPGSVRDGGTEYLKAYHNRNGRATEAFNVDFDGHSFSTKAMLPPDVKLYITVGARSTQLTLHRIVLFPCKGAQCSSWSPYWQKMVKKCVDSY